MENLIKEALSHRAINHPYLLALEKGEFQHTDEVLKDFASQYGAYSDWFSRYLTAVISKLENPTHRNHLLKNLAEENGHLHAQDLEAIRKLGIKDEWVEEIPHPQLFKGFQEAMGVDSRQTPLWLNLSTNTLLKRLKNIHHYPWSNMYFFLYTQKWRMNTA
jgi:pyrroloquinoline quinone (PQQ) biosynthesis protein C